MARKPERNHEAYNKSGFQIFFQVLFSTIRFTSVLSCEELLISSLHRSANI